jgi:hypothetical protein
MQERNRCKPALFERAARVGHSCPTALVCFERARIPPVPSAANACITSRLQPCHKDLILNSALAAEFFGCPVQAQLGRGLLFSRKVQSSSELQIKTPPKPSLDGAPRFLFLADDQRPTTVLSTYLPCRRHVRPALELLLSFPAARRSGLRWSASGTRLIRHFAARCARPWWDRARRP